MRVSIVNLSTRVSERECRAMIAACILQHCQHFCPLWGSMSSAFDYAGATKEADDAVGKDRALVLLLDNPDQANALGYHDEAGDQVQGKVFAAPVLDNGGSVLGDPMFPSVVSVSSVLSHELLELVGDPDVNAWRDGPIRAEGGQYAEELCDPVEADGYALAVADPDDVAKSVTVSVSNFVLPKWFDPEATSGPFDFMAKLSAPFSMSPGGYMIVRAGAPGTEVQVMARGGQPTWRAAGRAHPLSRASRRGT